MTSQMRIRYDETTWLESNFLAIFFEMSGFMVFEERIGELEELEVEDDVEEIIIVAERGNLDKQFIRDTIVKNLSGMVYLDDFDPIIDAYVDFSLYEHITDICYYRDWIDKISRETGDSIYYAIDFLEESIGRYNNSYLQYSILYLKYKMNRYCIILEYEPKYDIDKLADKCIEYLTNKSGDTISTNVLLGKIYCVTPARSPLGIRSYLREFEGYSYFNKAYIYYRIAMLYNAYTANREDSIDAFKRAIKILPNPIYLFNYINKLRNVQAEIEKDTSQYDRRKEMRAEMLNCINQLLEILNEKEKSIPLNPIEARIKIITLVYLMFYFFEEKDYLKVMELEYKLNLYYKNLLKTKFFDMVYTTEKAAEKRWMIKNRMRSIMKKGYSVLYYSYHYLGLEEDAKRCEEKVGEFS